jgi:hypothetical protein
LLVDIGQLGMTEDLEFYKLFGGPGMLRSVPGWRRLAGL